MDVFDAGLALTAAAGLADEEGLEALVFAVVLEEDFAEVFSVVLDEGLEAVLDVFAVLAADVLVFAVTDAVFFEAAVFMAVVPEAFFFETLLGTASSRTLPTLS